MPPEVPVLLLLTLIACREHPEGPPPPPDQPPSVDTAGPPVDLEAAASGPVSSGPLEVRKIALRPEKVNATTDLLAKVEYVGPKDRMISVRYTWLRNETPIDGQANEVLTHGFLHRNDRVQLQVELSDGERTVQAVSETLLVRNSPPTIEVPRGGLAGNPDGKQIRAIDPDNDTLSYRVEDGPPGLSIDSKGVLHFEAKKAAEGAGVYNAKIVVEDSGGEFAVWPLTLNLSAGKADERVMGGTPRP